MNHDGRTKAGLVGEDAALHTHLHGKGNTGTYNTAGSGLCGKGTLEDRNESSRYIADMHEDNDDSADQVKDDHDGNKLFRKGRDPLKSADDHQSNGEEEDNSRNDVGDSEGMVNVVGHTVYLAHVADAEGGQQTEAGEEDREHNAEASAAFFCTKDVSEVIHGASAPFSLGIFPSIIDTENILGIVGHHTEKCNYPQPEDCAGSAGSQSCGNTCNITRSDRSRKSGTQTLELAYLLIVAGSMRGNMFVYEDPAKSVLKPVSYMADLEKSRQGSHKNAGSDKEHKHRKSPYEVIDGRIYIFNQLHFSSPLNPKKTDANIFGVGAFVNIVILWEKSRERKYF